METKIIGIWNGYNVNLIKSNQGSYWTVTGQDGTEHNRFESPESFGHWVYHSGFKPSGIQIIKSNSGIMVKIKKRILTLFKARSYKYFKRIKAKNKWRYFYNQTEWNKYQKDKQAEKVPEKKIDILTAELKALESELSEAEADLKQAQSGKKPKDFEDVFSTEVEELLTEKEDVEKIKKMYKYGDNEEKLKKFYEDVKNKLPKEIKDKKKAKITVRATEYGVHLQIDYIDWKKPYKHYVGYSDVNENLEFTKKMILAEIKGLTQPVDEEYDPLGLKTKKDRPTKEKKKEIVRSEKFKNWFGDWESDLASASKVINEKTGEPQEQYGSGKPVKVFHGTAKGKFKKFEKEKIGEYNLYGKGFYFTEDEGIAEEYSYKDIEPDKIRVQSIIIPKEKREKYFNEYMDLYSKQVNERAGEKYREEIINKRKETKKEFLKTGKLYDILKDNDGDVSGYQLESAMKLEKKYNYIAHPQREIKEVYLKISNPMDLDKEVTDEEIKNIIKHGRFKERSDTTGKMETYTRYYYKHILDEFSDKKGSKILKKHKVDWDTAVTVNSVKKIWEAMKEHKPYTDDRGYEQGFSKQPGLKTGKMTYQDLTFILSDSNWSSKSKQQLSEYYQSKGYDGICHTGGWNIGAKDHKVWIAFEPTQIKASSSKNFDPKVEDMYKSKKIRFAIFRKRGN